MTAIPYEVYVIENELFWYDGSTWGKNPSAARRWDDHHSPKGGGAWKLHMALIHPAYKGTFTQTVLESGVGDPVAREQHWYDEYNENDPRRSLNRSRPHDWIITGPRSAEHSANISTALKGKPLSVEHRARLSAAKMGKKYGPHSAEHNANIGAAHRGRHLSAEHRAKLSAANKGKRHSPETKAKMSASRMGKTHSHKENT